MSPSVLHCIRGNGDSMQSHLSKQTTVIVGPVQDPTLCVVSLCRIPNLSNNDNLLIKNLKIVRQEMNNWTILFIFNNTCEMKWHMVWGTGKKEAQIELWMMNATFYAPVSKTSRKSGIWKFSTGTPRTFWIHRTQNLKLNVPFQVWMHLFSLVFQNSQTHSLSFCRADIVFTNWFSEKSLNRDGQKCLYGQWRQIVNKGRWAWQLAFFPPANWLIILYQLIGSLLSKHVCLQTSHRWQMWEAFNKQSSSQSYSREDKARSTVKC